MSRFVFAAAFTVLLFSSGTAFAQIGFDLETGLVFSGYNDVRVPGSSGTKFSLYDDLNDNSSAFFRARASYTFDRRHTVSLLVAPLSMTYDGTLEKDVDFAGESFEAGTEVDATYRFDSYRLTYRWDFLKRRGYEAGIGLTGKIRDAEIRLEGEGVSASKSNTGFVPLINFRFVLRPEENISLLVEGDALAAPQGRAEDVLFAFVYTLSPQWSARIGYRILEGGADNDEVYNFAFFNYTTIGVEFRP